MYKMHGSNELSQQKEANLWRPQIEVQKKPQIEAFEKVAQCHK